MWATILLYFVGIAMAILAYEIAITPPKNLKEKIAWRVGFVIFALLGIILTIYQSRAAQKQEEQSRRRFEVLQANFDKSLSIQSSNFLSKLAVLNTARQSYETFKDELMQNLSISTASRERMIEIDKRVQVANSQSDNLNDWAAGLRGLKKNEKAKSQIEHEKAMQDQQAYYEQNLPYFQDAVFVVTNLIGTSAVALSDTVVGKVEKIPTEIGPEIGEKNIAELSFLKRTNWSFKIFLGPCGSPQGRRPLIINCDGGSLAFWVSPGGVEADLSLIGDQTRIVGKPLSESSDTIKYYMRLLIAQKYEMDTGTNFNK